MILVITSCIAPPAQKNLSLQDSNLRYKYTQEGLENILKCKIFDTIIICDSSNFDFSTSTIEEMLKNNKVKYEFLKFYGNFDKIQEKGKGYGEGEIMQFLFNNSKLLYLEPFFYKITGRLYIENLTEIVSKIENTKNYLDIVALKFLQALDSRFYRFSVEDFKKSLIKASDYVDDDKGLWYEVVFRDLLRANKIKFDQFPVYPIIRGVSGTHGRDTFEKDIVYLCHVLTTKLHIHNSIFSAVILYIVVKVQQLLNTIIIKKND